MTTLYWTKLIFENVTQYVCFFKLSLPKNALKCSHIALFDQIIPGTMEPQELNSGTKERVSIAKDSAN